MTTVAEAAIAWHEAGASVLPAMRGKRPSVPWTEHQTERVEWIDFEHCDGFGIITGYGGFSMLEIEGSAMAVMAELAPKLAEAGYLARLMTYAERTPSGGIHWIFRIDGEQEGSQKLARDETGKTMIETRGRYAWVVVAPSGGSIHEEIPGGRWELMAGQPGQVATFTEQEIEEVYAICREFDRMPPPAPEVHRERLQPPQDGLLAPGQDYEARTTWAEILEPLGWKQTPGRGPGFWTRPGKSFGVSADITPDGNLYVFSSSAHPFEDGRSYTKFGAYALTGHGGRWEDAARELSRQGFGTPRGASTVGVDPIIRPENVTPETPPDPALRNPPEFAGPADELTQEEQSLAESDDGLAILLYRRYGERIRYCPDRGRWLVWNGRIWEWQPLGGGMVCEFYKRIARGLPATEKAQIKWKQIALGSKTLGNVVKMAQTDPRLVVHQMELDDRPDELNTPTGIVLLKTGELIEHDPTRLHTKMTLFGPDSSHDSRLWDRFMAETFAGDLEMISFMARLVGVSATGYTEPHILPFCSGTGGNGKGVFLETMMALLADYATAAPPNFLMVGPARHLTEMADLQGRRMVISSEVNEGDKFDEAKMKRLTGGDRIKANFMRQDMFSFDPTHHLWLVGNVRPTITNAGTNESVWRRVKEIKFTNEVPEESRIDGLRERLVTECGPAIMAWIVRGAADYFSRANGSRRGSLAIPNTVEASTADYRTEMDTVSQFVEERVRIGGGTHVTLAKSRVYEAYTAFCHEIGEDPVSPKAFTKALYRRGLVDDRNSRERFWYSVSLLDKEDSNENDQFRHRGQLDL